MSSKKAPLTKDKSRETLKRILNYIKQYKWAVVCSLILAMITVALTLYVPILIGRAVDRAAAQGQVDFQGVAKIIGQILTAVGLTALSQWLMNHINNTITYRVVMDIRTKAFDHVEKLPLSYLDAHLQGILSAG